MSYPVVIVDYDLEWPAQYAAEADRIRQALGDRIVAVEHIGSTVVPERRYFHKGPPRGRTHHLHMVEVGSDFWERHLLFRDILRAHPETARAYGALKRELAERHGADREAYTGTKTAFIAAAIERAREER